MFKCPARSSMTMFRCNKRTDWRSKLLRLGSNQPDPATGTLKRLRTEHREDQHAVHVVRNEQEVELQSKHLTR